MTKNKENLIEFAPGMIVKLHDFKGYTYPTIELYFNEHDFITLGEYYSLEDCKSVFNKLVNYITGFINNLTDFYFQM